MAVEQFGSFRFVPVLHVDGLVDRSAVDDEHSMISVYPQFQLVPAGRIGQLRSLAPVSRQFLLPPPGSLS